MTAPGKPIELWEFEQPNLESGAILLETVASEVCGTDVHLHQWVVFWRYGMLSRMRWVYRLPLAI
jgi:D-arabinose 1-dehydrogenase-like Zn-dependent alcohol dehydrogenase